MTETKKEMAISSMLSVILNQLSGASPNEKLVIEISDSGPQYVLKDEEGYIVYQYRYEPDKEAPPKGTLVWAWDGGYYNDRTLVHSIGKLNKGTLVASGAYNLEEESSHACWDYWELYESLAPPAPPAPPALAKNEKLLSFLCDNPPDYCSNCPVEDECNHLEKTSQHLNCSNILRKILGLPGVKK